MGLSRRERFEARRAVYGGSAVKDPRLAREAVAHACQLKARHRCWSRRWFQSLALDRFEVPIYVVFTVFLLMALMTRRRRQRKAEQAEAANQRLL
jgi:hypothetical protein